MTYSIIDHDTTQVIEVKNLYNEFDNKAILNDIQQRIESGFKNCVVDLSLLEFMNSVGLNFLLSIMSRSQKSGGNMAIANAPDQVLQLLEITKLKSFFNLQNSVEAALDTF